MRLSAIALLLCCAGLLVRADDRVSRMMDRLSEEASQFEQAAISVIGEETLRQRALKSGSRAQEQPVWQSRVVVSEYTYAGVGNTGDMREFRKVVSVDGRSIETSERALDSLAKALRSGDPRARKRMMEEFARHGLVGTASDIGQLILLFTRRNLGRYEFQFEGSALVGAERCFVFSYKQMEGPEGVTVWRGNRFAHQKLTGQVFVRQSDFLPLRIAFASVVGQDARAVREEAQVEYTMSRFGTLLPAAVVHREFRGDALTVENVFSYSNFRRFGASTAVQFDTESPHQE